MKKIISGLIMIALVAAVTSASAYAAFTASANVNEISFATGNAGIEVSSDNINFGPTVDYGVNSFGATLKPGDVVTKDLYVHNISSAAVTLDLAAQLVSATGDWGTLSPIIDVKIGTADHVLADWNTSAQSLSTTVAPSATTHFVVTLTVPSGADNTIAGKSLNSNWVITGTQSP